MDLGQTGTIMVPLLKLKKIKKKKERKELLLNNINLPSLTKSGSLSPNLTFLRLNNVFQEQFHPYSTFGLTRVFLTLKDYLFILSQAPPNNKHETEKSVSYTQDYLCILCIYCFSSLSPINMKLRL
jgi:hypothetical protein